MGDASTRACYGRQYQKVDLNMSEDANEVAGYCFGCRYRVVVPKQALDRIRKNDAGEYVTNCPKCMAIMTLHPSGNVNELRVESVDHKAVADVLQAVSASDRAHSAPAYERVAVFAFGVVFVIALLILAIAFPEPTDFQYTIFRIVLALAASGVAAFVPGFIEVNVRNWVRAGGAIAVFVVIYFFSPAGLVSQSKISPAPTDPFSIHMIEATPQGHQVNLFTFPFADISKKASYKEFTLILGKLPGSRFSRGDHTIFRVRDEMVLQVDARETAVSRNNTQVLVVPNSLLKEFESEHLAFTYLWSQVQQSATPMPKKQLQPAQ